MLGLVTMMEGSTGAASVLLEQFVWAFGALLELLVPSDDESSSCRENNMQ